MGRSLGVQGVTSEMDVDRPDSSAPRGRSSLNRRRFLQASAAAALAACAPGAPASPGGAASPAASAAAATPKRGGHLTILSGSGVSTLDPYFLTAGTAELSHQIFDSLIDFSGADALKPVGQLAESWQEADTTLTLKLRQGVKFHNGREFTSQDVVDNVARAKDKSIGHQLYAVFEPSVGSVDAIDKYTARINYKSLQPQKLEDISTLYIIPKENWADVTKHPLGTGPFKFVSHAPGSAVELERFGEYWQKDRPYLDKITDQIMTDPQARVANMIAGSGDVMPAPPRPDFDRLSKEANLQSVKVLTAVWDDIILNTSKKPFDNKLVRQAMNYTVDRAKINKLAYFGQLVESQTPFARNHWAYDDKANNFYKFDLEKAKALLAQAGYPSGFGISINVGLRPEFAQAAQIWAQDLAKVGITLKLNQLETAIFYTEYNKMNWDIQFFASGSGKQDPGSLVQSSPYRPIDNRARIDTQPFYDEYKSLFAQGLASIDRKVRKAAYDRLQELMAEEGFIIVLGFSPALWIVSKRVKDFRPAASTFQYYAPVWLDK